MGAHFGKNMMVTKRIQIGGPNALGTDECVFRRAVYRDCRLLIPMANAYITNGRLIEDSWTSAATFFDRAVLFARGISLLVTDEDPRMPLGSAERSTVVGGYCIESPAPWSEAEFIAQDVHLLLLDDTSSSPAAFQVFSADGTDEVLPEFAQFFSDEFIESLWAQITLAP
jgi:hypothetical protein